MTNTVTKIKQSALALIVEKGYTATSLADIGEKVGIKKQSIYSHFKSKDDLFLQVMRDVVHEEITFLKNYFTQYKNETLNFILYNFIIQLKERFVSYKEDNLRFLFRMMFIPPNHLQEIVVSTAMEYYEELKDHIGQIFAMHEDKIAVTAIEGKTAYLNFFDGLLVELVYIDVRNFEERLQVSWKIFQRGIEK